MNFYGVLVAEIDAFDVLALGREFLGLQVRNFREIFRKKLRGQRMVDLFL